jgi:hypothetical protein
MFKAVSKEDAMTTERKHLVSVLASAVLAIAAVFSARPVVAQDLGSFRVEVRPRLYARTPAVEGYVYNDGLYLLTDVRLKVEVLGINGESTVENFGWIHGDLGPHGRGYFLLPIPTSGAGYRVTVLSFDVVSRGTSWNGLNVRALERVRR